MSTNTAIDWQAVAVQEERERLTLAAQLDEAVKDRANWEAKAHAEQRERSALERVVEQHYKAYQRLLHENETLRAKLGEEVRANQTDTEWALVVNCDGLCGVPPIRIKVAPPEDAIPLWVAGMGWACDGDRYLCPCCKGGK